MKKKTDINVSITRYNKNSKPGMPADAQKYLILREKMVREQIEARGVRDKKVLDLMLTMPREDFISFDIAGFAYDDRPLPIGFGQTISQPCQAMRKCWK
jgi:hypothetical protein